MNNAAVGGSKGMGTAATVVGVILQLTVGFFTVTAIGLVGVPVWGIVVLAGAWLAAAAFLVRTVRQTPLTALLVPAANAVVLWGAVAAGGAWLGWSA